MMTDREIQEKKRRENRMRNLSILAAGAPHDAPKWFRKKANIPEWYSGFGMSEEEYWYDAEEKINGRLQT
jgi:hypothetical protein